MKTLALFCAGVAIVSCASATSRQQVCNFNGYSFCLALPAHFKVMASQDVGDFFTHIIRNEEKHYDVLIYEGNNPDLGLDPKTIKSFEQHYGEVTYSVDIVKSASFPYSVLLKREDIRIPTRVHITTDASNAEAAIDEVLHVIKGCKEITSVNFRCVL